MTPLSSPTRHDITTAFDAACVDVFRSRLQRPFVEMPGQHLLPRFAQHYEKLRALPRRARRSLQRQWKRTLGGVALLLALTPGAAFAATMNVAAGVAPDVKVDGKCSLIEAIVNANNNARTQPDCPAGSGTDTINLPANSKQTLTRAFGAWTDPDTTTRYQIALPQIKTPIVIEGHGSTIERADESPITLIVTIISSGNLTLNETHISGQPPSAVEPYQFGQIYASCVVNMGTFVLSTGSLRRCESYENFTALRNAGTATLRNSTVADNIAGYYGSDGAVVNTGTLTLTNSVVSNNRGAFSGAGISNSGTATIHASVISGNSTGTYDDGSGAGISNGGTLTVSSSLVTGNFSEDASGLDNSGTASITKTTFRSNDARYDAMRNSGGTLTLTNSTISENWGSYGCGGLKVNGGMVTLTHTTVTKNTGQYGGVCVGEYWWGGDTTVRVERSIIAGNQGDGYPSGDVQSEVYVREDASYAPTIIANNFNIFGYSGKSGAVGFTPGATDIIPTKPLSGILLPLANNGGTNPTHALAIGSPALNIGPVDDLCTATDQRGNPRPQGVKCDIGAFEGSAVLCNGLVTTQVGTVNADTLTGTNGVDVIAGLNGNDTLRGLNGNDVICAGSGADKVYGGNNNDRLFGDSENDQLYGDAGNDALSGGTGTDKCVGGTGTDTAAQCETVTSVP